VVVSPALAEVLDPAALRAVHEHESAHARHHDPLRIWLAELAADLQWPSPSARARLQSWPETLELARDDEARERGAQGPTSPTPSWPPRDFRRSREGPSRR
jgi:hypothetical protein